MEITTYYVDITEYNYDKNFAFFYNLCSENRKSKINKLININNKFVSSIAGALIYQLYCLYNGDISSHNIEYEYNSYGKPNIKNNPSFSFNISHSKDIIICTVYNNAIMLGCDIEKITEYKDKIAKRFYTDFEYEHLKNIQDINIQTNDFFRIWTSKESYLKALGIGITTELNSFNVQLPYNMGDIFKINDLYLKEYFINDNYSLTVCSDINNFDSTIKKYEFKTI